MGSGKLLRGIIHALLLLTQIEWCFAQEPLFINYSVDQGLPSSETYTSLQDKEGYIWISTDMGACRYNGYTFQKYTNLEGLSDNCVFDTYRDKHENIWFKTLTGNISYITPQGVIKTLGCNKKIKSWLKSGFIKSMYVDVDDNLYLTATSTHDYLRIKPPYNDQHLNLIDLPDTVHHYVKIIGKDIIFGNQSLSLDRIKKTQTITVFDKDTTHYIIKTKSEWPNTGLRCIRLRNGNLMLGIAQDIIILSKKGIVKQHHFKETIYDLYQAKDGSLWVSFHKGGTQRFVTDNFEKPNDHFFHTKSVTSVRYDKEDGIWITTLEDGIYYTSSLNYRIIGEPYIKDNRVTTIGNISNDEILAGMYDGNIISIEKGKRKIKAKYTNAPLNSVHQIFLTKNNDLWIPGPLHTTIYRNNHLRPVTLNLPFKTITEDENNHIWAASSFSLVEINSRDLSILKKITLPKRILRVKYLRNSIYICTLEGVYSYNFKQLQRIILGEKFDNLKFSDAVQTSDGSIYFSTIGNGIIIQQQNGKITNITMEEGLAGNMCRSLTSTATSVWVATTKGISQVIQRENKKHIIYNYTNLNALHTNDINKVLEKNDTLYLATNKGLAILPKEKLHFNKIPITITQISINGKPTALKNRYDLKHNEAKIIIKFVGLSFKRVATLIYEYKMEGIDTTWNTTTNTTLRYSLLPPGNYRLKIRALQENGILNPIKEFKFVVRQPFYTTLWFAGIVIIISILLFYLIFRYRISVFKQKEKEKSELERRIANIELKALRAQMNPHFIFNSLNAIQSFIVLKEWEKAQTYLTNFSRLVRNVLESSEHAYVPLVKEIDTLTFYLEIEKMRFGNRFSYVIEKDPSIYKKEHHIPPMLIQPYIENAIKHGLLLKKGEARIVISFSSANKQLRVTITDNGVGRKMAATYKMKKGETSHQSMGMKVTHERLSLLKASTKAKYPPVNIIDLVDNDGNAIGTRIELFIPN